MDLHIIGGEPTADEREAVDALLGPPESGWHGGTRDIDRDGRTAPGGNAITGQRHRLLPALHAVQDRVGWVSRGALNYICRRLTVPPAEAWGVLTFYHLLGTSPRPPVVAHVCDDIACRLRGAEGLCRDLEAVLGPPLGACRDGSLRVLKQVAALPGDRVEVAARGVLVNGKLLPGTAPLSRDSQGRPLPRFPPGPHRLGPGELWLLSGHIPNSWDSRYYGPVERAGVVSRMVLAVPLW